MISDHCTSITVGYFYLTYLTPTSEDESVESAKNLVSYRLATPTSKLTTPINAPAHPAHHSSPSSSSHVHSHSQAHAHSRLDIQDQTKDDAALLVTWCSSTITSRQYLLSVYGDTGSNDGPDLPRGVFGLVCCARVLQGSME